MQLQDQHRRSGWAFSCALGAGMVLGVLAGDAVAAQVRWEYDPIIDRIVSTWPASFDPQFGRSLGMRADSDFEAIVRAYMQDRVA